jgi:hypothetical protein
MTVIGDSYGPVSDDIAPNSSDSDGNGHVGVIPETLAVHAVALIAATLQLVAVRELSSLASNRLPLF